mmetsp:Transcript_32190/g.75581  ORF Transcript_32190/g.75581 Transcript_32190/m.75581 type:complete len:616 (+) Transcript_32190:153-2000(+)
MELKRVFFFTAGPGAFLLFVVIFPLLEPVELTGWDLALPLAGLVLSSIAGLVADVALPGQRVAVVVFQLSFQYIFLVYCLSAVATRLEVLHVPDQFQPMQTKSVHTISVVIPCLNETYAVQTVNRFCERTPAEFLEEIIVVDDFSWPPYRELLAGKVDWERCKLRILRHNKSLGLMVAKQTGGDAALGEFIGFFDCHVCPNHGWYVEIMKLLRAGPRRLVVPQIGDINVTTWDEKENGALTAKCYIDMNADFWWYDDESDFIPVISGGLVAIGRKWWQESGGFEKGMRGWGGENSDQSLRTWLCGGDIVRAKSSKVAHMWRTHDDKRTLAHYRAPQAGVDNLARVAASWFDEFQAVFRSQGSRALQGVNVAETLQKRRELGCKPFAYFLHRFRKIYVEGAILADKVFKIRNKATQKCIRKGGSGYHLHDCGGASWFHLANRLPPQLMQAAMDDGDDGGGSARVSCGGHFASRCSDCIVGHDITWCHGDCTPVFGRCLRKRDASKSAADAPKCCSGIREYKSLNCFDSLGDGGPLSYQCDVTGGNGNQQYIFGSDGFIHHSSGRCLIASGERVLPSTCDNKAELVWEKIDTFQADDMRLYREAVIRYNLSESIPDH